MVSIVSLWLPILLSAVFVFVLSSIIHMLLPYHRSDYSKVPDEGGVMDALRPFNIPPGDYSVPRASSMKDMNSPEFAGKLEKGPVLMMTVLKSGKQSMTVSLIQWFLFSIIVGIFAAYVSGRALEAGAHYLQVFRFVGVTSFLAYTLAGWQQSIWYKYKWSTTLKNTFDGLLYAFVTAGTFGWLWPAVG